MLRSYLESTNSVILQMGLHVSFSPRLVNAFPIYDSAQGPLHSLITVDGAAEHLAASHFRPQMLFYTVLPQLNRSPFLLL
jgi:hypothetical protein